MSFTVADRSRCPYGWFESSLSSFQYVSDRSFPSNNFSLIVPVDLHEPSYELAIFPATAGTLGIVFVPVDFHCEKPRQHSRHGRQIRKSTWNLGSFHARSYFGLGQSAFGDFVMLINVRALFMNARASLSHFTDFPSLNGFDDESASEETLPASSPCPAIAIRDLNSCIA